MRYVLVFIYSYLIGCIPVAYLLVKSFKKQDIRKLGSGNVGTLNTFETTNSKTLAITTLLGDMSKAVLVLFITNHFFLNCELCIVISSIACVIGHNFNIFLWFKGGRGLATSACLFALINPLLLIYWLIIWLISKKISKDIHKSNIIATIVSPIIIIFTFTSFLNFLFPISEINYIVLSIFISIIILLGHRR